MSHAHVGFSVFEALFDGPAHGGGFAHLRHGDFFRGAGEGVFDLAVAHSPHKEPDGVVLGKAVFGREDPESANFGDHRPLGALGEDARLPCPVVGSGDFRDSLGFWFPRQNLDFL